MMEIQPLEPSKFEHQEHSDSFYDLLNKELDADLEECPIWLAEAIKLRFGLGSYTTPTPIQEIGSALGIPYQSVQFQIKRFFEKQGN